MGIYTLNKNSRLARGLGASRPAKDQLSWPARIAISFVRRKSDGWMRMSRRKRKVRPGRINDIVQILLTPCRVFSLLPGECQTGLMKPL